MLKKGAPVSMASIEMGDRDERDYLDDKKLVPVKWRDVVSKDSVRRQIALQMAEEGFVVLKMSKDMSQTMSEVRIQAQDFFVHSSAGM